MNYNFYHEHTTADRCCSCAVLHHIITYVGDGCYVSPIALQSRTRF